MQSRADTLRAGGRTLALVPTMGGLHDGHLALVRRARQECDHVTVSIFVNPVQFGPGEDYASYPGNMSKDIQTLVSAGGVSTVFSPTPQALFPAGRGGMRTWVDNPAMACHLCGRHRPGHFRGVLTIVTKLLHCCRPHSAFFGLKDAQQYFLLKRMIQELDFGVCMVGVETVRESDGLAMSTRNAYLNSEERGQATVLSRAVGIAGAMIQGGEQDPALVVQAMRELFSSAPLARLEYAGVICTETLAPVDRINRGQEVLAAVAAWLGSARLIDNVIVTSPMND